MTDEAPIDIDRALRVVELLAPDEYAIAELYYGIESGTRYYSKEIRRILRLKRSIDWVSHRVACVEEKLIMAIGDPRVTRQNLPVILQAASLRKRLGRPD